MSRLGVLLPLLLLSVSCQADPLFNDLVQSLDYDDNAVDYLLPKTARPLSYDILLEPNIEEESFFFTGSSDIVVEVLNKTTSLTLNSRNLTIESGDIKLTTIGSDKEKPVEVKKKNHVFEEDKEFLIINFEQELAPKKYNLHIKFNGKLNNEYRGFYRSSYLDKNNKRRWLATTHFEPTGARRAFPCWDEPSFKATFKIALKHDNNYKAISNMAEDTKLTDKKKTTTHFKTTPLMSTYLVAFVVSDYEKTENKEKTFRVWTKPHAINTTKYALEFGQKALGELDKFTDYKYSKHFEKMDQISIPDFLAGAMENWGLVTYRESALLYEEGVTTTRAKQSIATIISHEFAHQWFGNLVSPAWWKYLWLNEGFATYFQYYITDKVEPDWRLMELFVVEALQGVAFATDASDRTHAMNQDAFTPSNIQNLFDNIAYQKAGSIIRMISHVLKESVFQDGLKKYLTDNALGIAESKTLFDAFEAASKNSGISKLMNEWVNKPGYPTIHVTRNKKGDLEVRQERFSFAPVKDDVKWSVPITYTTEDNIDFENTTVNLWLKPDQKVLTIPKTDAKKWVIFNKQQAGYYRVNYDDKNWELITKYLAGEEFNKTHPLNRAQLIDDSLNLARAGKLNYSIALSLSLYLTQEVDYIPWTAAFRNFVFLETMMDTSEKYDIFKQYLKYTMKELVKNVKFEESEDDDHITKLLRVTMLKWACKAEIADCQKYVEKEFKPWLEDPKHKTNVDLKNDILCAHLRTADEKTWNKTLERYSKIENDDEKKIVLTALACSESEKILQLYLKLALDPKKAIDFNTAFSAIISQSSEGYNVALDALVESYELIQKAVGDDGKLKSHIKNIGSFVVGEKQYVKLGLLLTRERLQPEIQSETMKTAGVNLNWVDLHRKEVEQWLEANEETFNSASSVTLTTFLMIASILVTRFY